MSSTLNIALRHLMAGLIAGGLVVFLGNPAGAAEKEFTPQERAHWAFQKVIHPDAPKVKHSEWVRNPIDAFVLAELETRRLSPAPRADKRTLIRRAYLDLIGLPPSPAEVEAFVADNTPAAFTKVVEHLLGRPEYGERWARHWLDLARYAESEGFKADETRPNAWRYRDYVIQSLNADKPYDRFVQEQIAGDELWPADPDARIATAFNRHYPDESNARNLRQRRQEILNDITDTVGAVFTGMTYACARCHDHKFDPIRQSDYYRLQAFFANTAAQDDLVLASADEAGRHREKLTLWEEKTRDLRAGMNELEEPKRREIEKDYFEKYPEEVQEAWNTPESGRSPYQKMLVWKARQYLDPASREYIADPKVVVGKLKGKDKQRWQELSEQLGKFSDLQPDRLPVGSAMIDLSAEAPQTFLLNRGIFDQPREEVPPGLLQILYRDPAPIAASPGDSTTRRRTALANLLTDPANPLTARVMANRVWQHHFGRGIVGTPSDFGVKGDRPTHPALLDWLAGEFVKNGWSLKQLHRLIMSSSAYQQTSAYRADAAAVDPGDQWLWRFPRQRLEGEVIRDAGLAVAGLLNPKMGGPSVFPELPEGMVSRGGWNVNKEMTERNRRSIYVFVRRNTRYPMFETFDMPDTHETCAHRNVTTGPLQALTLLNSKQSLEWARGFAARVLASAGDEPGRQIDTAYRLAFSRSPDATERRLAREFFRDHRAIIQQGADRGEHPLPLPLFTETDPLDAAVLVDFCHALLNANEFVYQN